jgi:adenylate kinase
MMRIILLGAPGSGKGTQAVFIAEKLNIPHIATGDMLRNAVASKSELGLKVKSIMEAGDYISDTIMVELVRDRITTVDCQDGFLLDGFPRTIAQAKELGKICKIDLVIEIDVPHQIIIDRLSGRRIHLGSGRVYHISLKPPRVPNKDDFTGEDLIMRADDNPSNVQHRLDVYDDKTKPLVDWYKSLSCKGLLRHLQVNGNQDLAIVKHEILDGIRGA